MHAHFGSVKECKNLSSLTNYKIDKIVNKHLLQSLGLYHLKFDYSLLFTSFNPQLQLEEIGREKMDFTLMLPSIDVSVPNITHTFLFQSQEKGFVKYRHDFSTRTVWSVLACLIY